jgi:tRNA G10  N-methylase Trm11
MQYKYTTEQQDYSDLASGRVFYSLPGHPAFPVRLASEIFQRSIAHRAASYGVSTPCVLYDPCCGAAYHLSILAYLHSEQIQEIIGSDIDEKAVALARKNLGLLGMHGLDQRINEISELLQQYGKDSHKDALRSASVLKKKLSVLTAKNSLKTRVFQANVLDQKEIEDHIRPKSVDIIFTDVPYGQHSQWYHSGVDELSTPVNAMLEVLLKILSPASIVAIASDKQQKVSHERYERIERFQVGRRRVVILRPV